MKTLLLIFLLSTAIFANTKTITATYKVSYGIFGKLGLAKTTLTLYNNKKYKIEVSAYATGISKVLSSEKEERYTSEGYIEDNKFIPLKYIKISQNSYKKRTKEYNFNYTTNTIVVNEMKKELKTTYDINFNPISKWEENNSTYKTKYFAQNDLLSLFFNIKREVPNFNKGSNYSLCAIGANKKDGIINIIIPKEKSYELLEESLSNKSDIKFIAQINQKIFSSANGELLISLNEKGFCNKAILKDVLIFGDIIGEIIKFEIKES